MMLSITRQISNYNHSASNNIKYLCLHDTGNYKDTAQQNADYFCGGDRQSSAHYFVDDNSIYQIVEESDASWHCGDGGMQYGIGNHNSIGVEMCNSGGYISDATINNTLDLVKMLMQKYNISIDKIVRHYDASRKICPRNMSDNNWEKWYNFKNRLQQGGQKKVKTGVLLFTKDDAVTGFRIAEKFGNCAVFVRKDDYTASSEVMNCETLYIVGGQSIGHPNEVILSGASWWETVVNAKAKLGF